MDDMGDMRAATDSDDDLEITQSMRKELGHEDYIKSAPLSPHPYPKLRNDTPALRSRKQTDFRRIVCGREA